MEANQVADVQGNPVASGLLGTFTVALDTVAPVVDALNAADVTVPGVTTYTFTVQFSDNDAIQDTTFGNNDVRVVGPDGFDQLATFVSQAPPGSGSPIVATYQITPPGGSWDRADNSVYLVSMEANQVADVQGNPVASGLLGTFTVAITGPTAFVARFYQYCLGREPDTDGLDNWVGDLVAGTKTGADVAVGFMFSAEYVPQNTSDEQFIDTSYRVFFGRDADAPGKAHWVATLDAGAPREDVLYGFVYSGEFTNLAAQYGMVGYSQDGLRVYRVRQFVTRFYVESLGRQPDADGLANWTADLLAQTRAGVEVAFGFMFSPEYLLRNRTDSEFVDDSYRAFFNREPDAGGKTNWEAVLAGGASRADVLKGFTDSLEFANLCGLYDILPNLP